MSWAKRRACSSGRLTRRLSTTDPSSLTAASTIPTIISAWRKTSSRSASERDSGLRAFSRCSRRYSIKSLMPKKTAPSITLSAGGLYRSGAGLFENLRRHFGRIQGMGVLLGEPARATPEKGGYLLQLRERLFRPLGTLHRRLFAAWPLRFPQNAVEGVGKLARPNVAYEWPLHERVIEDRGKEGEKGYVQCVGDLLF